MWILYNDSNTQVFHATAVTNKKRYFIKALRNDEGIWIKDIYAAKDYLLAKFSKLFTSCNSNMDTNFVKFFNP